MRSGERRVGVRAADGGVARSVRGITVGRIDGTPHASSGVILALLSVISQT
jgi:hypothetical protein